MAVSTPEQLILAAERLCAERGIDQVSLRQIAEAAGQRNPAVVQYHFGSKTELLRAVVRHRVEPINARRLELLAALDAAGRADDLHGLVDASIRPLAELGPAESRYVGFVAQLIIQDSLQEVFAGIADELRRGAHLLEPRFQELLGDVPTPLWEHRQVAAFSAALLAIARFHRQRAKGVTDVDLDVFVDDLVGCMVGFLTAPVPPLAEPLAEPRATPAGH
jgi:AcrR family transcriptional regulator